MAKMQDIQEAAGMIGQRCHWIVPGAKRTISTKGDITIPCRINDARIVFGRTEVQIVPMEGTGMRWVCLESVELI